jgi:hypothetical protein
LQELPSLTVSQRQLLVRRALDLDEPGSSPADGCIAGKTSHCASGKSRLRRPIGNDEIPSSFTIQNVSWRVEFRPEVESEVAEAAQWYSSQPAGLGAGFVEGIIHVWHALADKSSLKAWRHPRKNIRWRYPERFPYRVNYDVLEAKHSVVVAAVLRAARDDKHWRKRVGD